MLTALQLMAGEPISLKDITSGVFWAKRISGVNPLKGTSEYAQVSADGRQVVKYSFRTGKPTGVIFDLSDVKEGLLKVFDDYQISADGCRLLLQTNTNRIYRRSFTADFYLYEVKTKQLKELSKDGAEQIPVFRLTGGRLHTSIRTTSTSRMARMSDRSPLTVHSTRSSTVCPTG